MKSSGMNKDSLEIKYYASLNKIKILTQQNNNLNSSLTRLECYSKSLEKWKRRDKDMYIGRIKNYFL